MNPNTTRDDSFPDLGTIDDYDAERGCGHVLGILEQELFFFHIAQVPEIPLQRQMMSGQTTYRGKHFSYNVRKAEKGYEAFSVQAFSPRVPGAMQGERRRNYTERIRAGLRSPDAMQGEGPRKWIEHVKAFRHLCYGSKPDDLRLLLCLLVNSRETTDEYLGELMCSSFSDSERNLSDLIAVLPASRLSGIRSNINIERRWLDIGASIPSWLRSLTSSLYGDDELARLSGCRDDLEDALERKRTELQKAKRRECWENVRRDPAGIRNKWWMADVCLECGSHDVERVSQKGFQPNQECRNCDSKWHVDHCWSCSGMVDSRDPETPRCLQCNWLICSMCGACTDPRSDCPGSYNVNATAYYRDPSRTVSKP